MFVMKDEQKIELVEGVRGGKGKVKLTHVVPQELLEGPFKQFNYMEMEPGSFVGEHTHDDGSEICQIIEGTARYTDDGVARVLHAGDTDYCLKGHSHKLENTGDGVLKCLACILKY